MAVMWTKEQKQVIDLRNRSLLVSAAAGSGKTAVLVERIVSMISEGEHPLDVDQLLVVTFTNAAAAQMRERVQRAIEARLETDPENRHLKRQQTLIHQAKITTIDSFCLSVLREQFHQIDLDPGFRIGDEGELRLLREDVLKVLVEEKYREADPAFIRFWEAYNPGRDDNRASGLILSLYEFTMANPRPKTWLKECRKAYEAQTTEELSASGWMQGVCRRAILCIRELTELCRRIWLAFSEEDGMESFEDVVHGELMQLERACEASGYEEIRKALAGITFGRKPRKKKTDSFDEDKANRLWEQRGKVKDELEALYKGSFSEELKEVLYLHQLAGEHAKVLADLTEDFLDAYRAAKAKRNLVDFHDLEHMALDILSEETEDGEVPTDAAKEYAARFEEIMIDEYQDSNYVQELILTSISREREGQPNCFMVGDVKQSIYRFRLARPELFMQKYASYTAEESAHQKIELHQNFRSRADVLEAVNYFFYQIMHSSLGNVEYNKEAALYPGMEYEPSEQDTGGPVKLLLLDTEQAIDPDDEDAEDGESEQSEEDIRYNVREWEAVMIAEEIRKLTDKEHGKQIWDAELQAYRTAEYRDITILLRTISGWAEDFLPVLASRGIPAAAESGTGYFSAIEVQTVINLLQIINNPIQDIPLTGVMHSPIGGFGNEELAKLKLGVQTDGTDGLYGVLRSYTELYPDEMLSKKVQRFLERLSAYRRRASYLPLHELVSYVMEDSGYYDYVCAMPGGERRRANLDMLLEKAERFEATSYQGVFQFVRYLEKLRTYSVDYPEAGDNSTVNAVRIMSIHKSKGLEFPIVIAAGLGKRFNQQDARQSVILHPDYGIGADAIDVETRTTAPTLMKKSLARELILDNLGEELRVLYVAMTRAKEVLILSGARKSMFEWLDRELSGLNSESRELSWLELSSAQCYLDWIVPAMAKHNCFDAIYKRFDMNVPFMSPWYKNSAKLQAELVMTGQLGTIETARRLDAAWYRNQLEELEQHGVSEESKDDSQMIKDRFSYDYCYDDMYRLRASLSVSEIKKESMQEREEEIFLPKEQDSAESVTEHTLPHFMSGEERLSGAQRGTLYHYLFEHLDPCASASIKEQIAQLEKKGILNEQQKSAVKLWDFTAFYETELGKRCIRARKNGTFHSETPFCLGVPASVMNPEDRVGKDSYVKIHGVIDAWFAEEDKLILYDYKTDRISGENWEEELSERYRVQLSFYRMALERMTGRRIDEIYLYSVTKRKAVPVSF